MHMYIGPVHFMVTPNVSVIDNDFVITVSWQVPIHELQCKCVVILLCSTNIQAPQFTSCTANIIMYNITVMDQYSPVSVTVPADMSSAEISQFPDNGTSIVANRNYTITVSAISDQGTSYPSDPVTISKYSFKSMNIVAI